MGSVKLTGLKFPDTPLNMTPPKGKQIVDLLIWYMRRNFFQNWIYIKSMPRILIHIPPLLERDNTRDLGPNHMKSIQIIRSIKKVIDFIVISNSYRFFRNSLY